jgi:4-diphosphocytidyl-2-C-methyl-D-erythritol kinase
VIVFPNCKINLGLNIIRKRSDGFHDLETVFYPIPIYDVLEIVPAGNPESQYEDISFTTSGILADENKENNLCFKAYQLLKKDFPAVGNLKMHLHKTIPAGAGLGGGSADASFTLNLLNKIVDLKLTEKQLIDYSVELGSDCPFFIINKPCFATGKGEILEPIEIDFSLYKFILVNPGIHIHTSNAFSKITPALPNRSVKEIVQEPVSTWKETLKNDFEDYVAGQYPEIKKIKDELYDKGAIYASMSGTGSTVYGIVEKEKNLQLSFDRGVRPLKTCQSFNNSNN